MQSLAKSAFVPQDFLATLDYAEIFDDTSLPLEIDLGCGDGGFLMDMAEHFPERNFLGIERLLGRVRAVCRKSDRRGLGNVKLLRIESLYALEYLLPAHSVSRLHLLCPDPWPKLRHHRRRLVQQPFLTALARVLKPGGEFLFKTDHEDYFNWVLEHVKLDERYTRTPWQGDEFYYAKTDFQRHWESQGLELFQARFTLAK